MDSASLDALDRRIIRAIQEQADISQAALAQAVGASPASCWRRIKLLESRGVLGKTVRLVDPEKVNKGITVICQIKMKSHDHEARTKFEEFINNSTNAIECYSISGEWDYLIIFILENINEFHDFLMNNILQHKSVYTSSSHFALKRVKYSTSIPV